MKKLLITLLTLLLTFCALVGLTACEEPEPQAPEIDYSKYNYYGNYCFRSNLSNGGTLELNFKLGKDNKYKMTLDVYSSNALRLIDVTEEGAYSMSTLYEPIYDETFNTIYMLVFNPSISTGIVYPNPINGYYGYITQVYLADYWWYYIDNYQYGASVYFGEDDKQFKAEYSKLKYEVTYIASAGGKINGYTNQSIIEGEDGVEVTAVADYGYIFDSWSDGVTTATRKETNVNGDITVTANFKDGEQGGGSGSNEDSEQGGGSGSNEDGEQGGGSGSNEDGEQGGGSGSNEDGDQNEDKPIYELEYVYSEELQGYSVAGIKLSGSSQLLCDVVIPSTYRSVAVKGIDTDAFSCVSFLRSIEIPEGVEKIGTYAFGACKSLEKVQLPSTILEIFNSAFMGCYNLKDINLPEGILSIPYGCFSGCQSLTQINIPSTVLNIGSVAFYGCSSLQSVNLNSVSFLGYCAFEDCVNLKSITIPDTVAECGENIFSGCEGLSKVYIDSAVFANSMNIGYYLKYTTDVYVRTDIETTVSIYSMAYNLLSTEEIDGVEYYHYQIKE